MLTILDNLHSHPEISQNELGLKTGLSGAMVNQYLKGLHKDGLLRLTRINGKSFRYDLTEKGEHTRRELMELYLAEVVQIYSGLKQTIEQSIQKIIASGVDALVLFGAAETCEIVLAVLQHSGIRVMLIVDNDPAKQGHNFHGHIIAPPALLENIDFQGLLITSFARQREIKKQLQPLAARKEFQIFTLE